MNSGNGTQRVLGYIVQVGAYYVVGKYPDGGFKLGTIEDATTFPTINSAVAAIQDRLKSEAPPRFADGRLTAWPKVQSTFRVVRLVEVTQTFTQTYTKVEDL